MTKTADLHVHTNFSDGTFSPKEVVEYSKSKGLDAIAITDHDCCDGIEPAIMAGKDLGIEVIPGVELSAELDDAEVHILGYFIDWQNEPFLKKLDKFSNVRLERAKEILQKLRGHGIDLLEEELFELSGSGSIGRLHIAQLLFKKGFVSSVKEAFTKYISDSGPCYVEKFKLSPKEASDLIKEVGGISVLAHPKTINISDISIEELVRSFVKDGIQGVEVYHTEHKAKDETKLKALAEKYNLLVTGGSDCHGAGKKHIMIGKVKVPYELVERLKSRISTNKNRITTN